MSKRSIPNVDWANQLESVMSFLRCSDFGVYVAKFFLLDIWIFRKEALLIGS